MKKKWYIVIILFNLFAGVFCYSQEKPIILNSVIGDTLDLNERDHYRLFKNIQGFQWAVFYPKMKDSVKIKICYLHEGNIKDTIIDRYSTLVEIRDHFDLFDNMMLEDSNRINQLKTKYWAHLGLGGGSFGISYGINFTMNTKSNLLSFRFNYNEKVSILGGSDPTENVWDLGVLYGTISKTDKVFISAEAGLGIVSGTFHGKYLGSSGGWFGTSHYEALSFLTIGVPFQAKVFWITTSGFGIGLSGYGNLNVKKSFVGIMLCVHFGKVH